MAEGNTAEVEAKVDAAFGAAFIEDAPPPAIVETPAAPPVVAEPPKVETPAPAPLPPKYARVLQQDWDNLKASAGKVANLESQVAKLMGSSAPTAERLVELVLERVQAQTPLGLDVEITDEDFAEYAADFPELSKHNITGLQRLFKKARIKGTGPVAAGPVVAPTPQSMAPPPAPPVDENSIADLVQYRVEEKALKRTYPDWSDIVGQPPIPGAPVPETPYRAWLAKQSAEYQKAVNETNSPAEVQESISHYKASLRSAVPDRAAARRAVIEDAVTPRAEGNPPPLNAPQTAEDAFGEGYRQVKSR